MRSKNTIKKYKNTRKKYKNTRKRYKTQKRSKNLKGGNREARYSIDGYMVYDEEKKIFLIQPYGTLVHEETVKKANTRDLQLYDDVFNPAKPPIKYYSPRLNETGYTFDYLTANRTNRENYNYKLRKDLSYIFYSITNGIPIIVKNKTTNKSEIIILKDSELYFKIKIMEKSIKEKLHWIDLGDRGLSHVGPRAKPPKILETHKFITVLLCSKKKITINKKQTDLELFLCSFGVDVKGRTASLSLPDKFNNSVTSVDKFKLNISEKYKILELLYLLTKAPYNFNSDEREDGFQQFVTDDKQFPNFIKDILKDYTGKSLLETFREYETKTVLKKNTYKFASFLKDEYTGYLDPFIMTTEPWTMEEMIESTIVDIMDFVKKGAFTSDITESLTKQINKSKSKSKTPSKTKSKSKSKSKSKIPSISSDSDDSPGFRRSISKEVNNDSLKQLYDTLKQELNKTYLELDKKLYTSFEGLQKSVKGSLSKRKKKKTRVQYN